MTTDPLRVGGGELRDGRSASGKFTGAVEFMKLRAQRLPRVVHEAYVPRSVTGGDETVAELAEEEFTGGVSGPQRFVLGLRVPDCVQVEAERRGGARPVWLYGLRDRSWACAYFREGGETRVWQGGPRRLWDEAEAAHRWWAGNGRPGCERFGLTVTAKSEEVWLDDPGEICWLSRDKR